MNETHSKTSQIELIPYSVESKGIWDKFIEESRNGTFLLKRGYMDYHSDRFKDRSLILLKKGNPLAVFPACENRERIISHAGLTYGGLIMGEKCTAENVLNIFELIKYHYKGAGFKELIYKPVPHIYHNYPAEEDLYALFRNEAKLLERNISSTIFQKKAIKFTYNRRWIIKKAIDENDINVEETKDYAVFWPILEANLKERHGVKPVHSLEEIELLASRFPFNIKLFVSKRKNEVLAGSVCYEMSDVVHTQYISSTKEGKNMGAVDVLLDYLINYRYKDKTFFDFGISNEDHGRILNESLIFQKESFGARGTCYDVWGLKL